MRGVNLGKEHVHTNRKHASTMLSRSTHSSGARLLNQVGISSTCSALGLISWSHSGSIRYIQMTKFRSASGVHDLSFLMLMCSQSRFCRSLRVSVGFVVFVVRQKCGALQAPDIPSLECSSGTVFSSILTGWGRVWVRSRSLCLLAAILRLLWRFKSSAWILLILSSD
jgi:hypothetical protein